MDFIENLENEIAQQTRNGRKEVYITVEDLTKLGCKIDPKKTGRVFVDVNYLQLRIQRYKFTNTIKIEPKDITFRELEDEIKQIEKGDSRE